MTWDELELQHRRKSVVERPLNEGSLFSLSSSFASSDHTDFPRSLLQIQSFLPRRVEFSLLRVRPFVFSLLSSVSHIQADPSSSSPPQRRPLRRPPTRLRSTRRRRRSRRRARSSSQGLDRKGLQTRRRGMGEGPTQHGRRIAARNQVGGVRNQL